ncbi:hypothetical protein GUJ93_ZPchr0121g63 [Zizania palustris]|uniref:Allene oxide synthase n=1 Tax=Zizania palustris TaxID=103762 RepID=A0A8J5RP14_ZIZPA|nr:hypothetical protein GUJ93_ZPchr0121g63 [Zizania palustris]
MHHVGPAFSAAFTAMFDAVEAGLDTSGPVEFNKLNMKHMLDFTSSALFGGTPQSEAMGNDAVFKPWLLEDLLLHTFRLPPFMVRRDYADLTAYFAKAAAAFLDNAEKNYPGIPRDELLHNLIFVAIFNAYGGFKIFLPHLVKWLARAGPELHARLADEVRAAVPAGGEITLTAVDRMPLVKSVVWEALRMNPPVEFQYGRARRDIVVESHDAAYEVRKGELLFGDDDALRRRLLEHVVWSNGPETGTPAEGNKQCPGKDTVVAVGRLMVAKLFQRYDTFAADVKESPVEPVVTFTSLTRAAADYTIVASLALRERR